MTPLQLLITGINGLIGTILREALQENDEVYGLDSDHGVSKAFGEAVARYYSNRLGIKAICRRMGAPG